MSSGVRSPYSTVPGHIRSVTALASIRPGGIVFVEVVAGERRRESSGCARVTPVSKTKTPTPVRRDDPGGKVRCPDGLFDVGPGDEERRRYHWPAAVRQSNRYSEKDRQCLLHRRTRDGLRLPPVREARPRRLRYPVLSGGENGGVARFAFPDFGALLQLSYFSVAFCASSSLSSCSFPRTTAS